MANAFAGAIEFRWDNGTVIAHGAASIATVPTGNQSIQSIQSIGTSAEAIALGDVGPGYLFFKNLDATNYIDIGAENTAITPIIARLQPGEAILIPTTNASWWAKANTAGCDLLVIGVDA